MAESFDTYSDIEEDEPLDYLTETFNRAAEHVKKLTHLQPPQLLEIYGFYKQAINGPCNIPKPRFYEMQAKAKWDAWNKLENMPKDEAKKQYIQLISDLDSEFDPTQNSSERWVTVSTFINTDEIICENDKTVFDYCKEGNLHRLMSSIENNSNLLSLKDENGLGLIHWAADRGNLDILKFLIKQNIDINMIDSDGQTALHYAASCDYLTCVEFLMNSGANCNITDSDGAKPIDLTNDENIKKLLNNN